VFYEFCQVFHDPERGVFDDEFKQTAFVNLTLPQTTSTMLHDWTRRI
jgi:hypothetical protein